MTEQELSGATAGAPSLEVKTEGWYGPPNSRRFHYFREGRSLCGKWMVFVSDAEVPWDCALGPVVGDCAACTRKLDTPAAATAASSEEAP